MNKYQEYAPQKRKVAYFSFEIGLSEEMPVYAGGLGILAGDTIKSFADLGVPVVALSLLNEKGYFYQVIDGDGNQLENPVNWDHSQHMRLLSEKVTVNLEGRDVLLQAWVHEVDGIGGHKIPVLFLDSNIKTNDPEDRKLTSHLYGGDSRYRFKQEAILGIGGVRMLQVLDHDNLVAYHMNEGHSALLSLELMDRYENDIERVRELCVFTTHTPVPAGHDRFERKLVETVLGDYVEYSSLDHDDILDEDERLNMTHLALYHSKYINGVAKMHGEVAQEMFPEYNIEAITNGIHPPTWVSEPMAKVFDKHIPPWRIDPYVMRFALRIPGQDVWNAHATAKKNLIDFVNKHYKTDLDYDTMTIGFGRRATAYKRPDLLLTDTDRLLAMAEREGGIQVIYGGKAHPKDTEGKKLLKKIIQEMRELSGKINMIYLNNYDMYSAKLLVSGSDLWLNTPLRPLEASGTSGMKAAVNGVLNFSVLDGWWIEGHIEDFTGWSIGPSPEELNEVEDHGQDAEDLYQKLEDRIIPMYYGNRGRWIKMMVNNIAFNGSYFNTHRMVSQYVVNAYFQ
ncbi:MAG: alpha-glucan family phosphorylase [Candidatus Altiarchaeota archaeon]